MTRNRLSGFACAMVAVMFFAEGVGAADPPPGNVPPTLEIEVLDPGVDPLGNPAVLTRRGPDGQLQVDIPPVVLVHRYYYTGDRSFQAQLLPGGPSIVVANHPKTGERCYIPVQMLPGAPRVIYSRRAIEYDYGEHGIRVVFPHDSKPVVKYRSGRPWDEKLAKAVHAEHWKNHVKKVGSAAKHVVHDTKDSIVELFIDTERTLEQLTLPIKNIARLVPMANAAFDPDRVELREAKIAEYRREKELERLRRQQQADEVSLRTVR